MRPTRRQLLAGLAATAGATTLPWTARATETTPRLAVVLLRGALDGLHAVPAIGDPSYAIARGRLALDPSATLPLDDTFALHPSMSPLHPLWEAGELLVAHATATPYRGRSHFDGQDALESAELHRGPDAGWLGRALTQAGQTSTAVGPRVPLLLQGAPGVSAVDPTSAADPDEGFLRATSALWAEDPVLGPALSRGLKVREQVDVDALLGRDGDDVSRALEATGRLLVAPGGPQVAALGVDGWDTHARQGTTEGLLANRLASLAHGLSRLRAAVGDAWSHTVVVVLTEFGRTVAANGTFGTDHGTGGIALVMGGGVRGRVLADWPGLARADQLDGRDLRPTADTRQLLAGVLHDHLGLGEAALRDALFRDGTAVDPVGILRV